MTKIYYVIVFSIFLVFSCGRTTTEMETNKILQTLVKQAKDSTAVYFQKVDSPGEEKIETVIRPKEPDSVAIYYKSVDSLRFNIPIAEKDFKQYELGKYSKTDSLISNETVEQWNREIEQYKPRKWSKKERGDLPVLNKKPEYLNGYSNPRGALQKMLYFSVPFFNEDKTKALIYRYKFSYDGKNGQLYILSKDGQSWNVIYNGVTFVSSF